MEQKAVSKERPPITIACGRIIEVTTWPSGFVGFVFRLEGDDTDYPVNTDNMLCGSVLPGEYVIIVNADGHYVAYPCDEVMYMGMRSYKWGKIYG